MQRRFASLGWPMAWLGPVLLCLLGTPRAAAGPEFDRIVIDADFPGGYQVEVADVNGDKKPDLVALGGGTCAWYENPTWKKRIITGPSQTPGIISSAAADLDGDGKAEVAIAYEFAMNDPKRGKLLLAAQGKAPDAPWVLRPVGAVPSIHRVRWGDVEGDGKRDLIVAPIFGLAAKAPKYDQQSTQIGVFRALTPDAVAPKFEPIRFDRILHAIEVTDLFSDGRSRIVTASAGGTSLIAWGKRFVDQPKEGWDTGRDFVPPRPGSPAAEAGASEVHVGRMADGRCLLVTIEPWHGNRVLAYTAAFRERPEIGRHLDPFGPGTLLDDTLDDGHALWVADIDGDGNDEVFAGHRGKDHRVSIYRLHGEAWSRTIIDRDIAAQDLRGGDLDGDGTPDVVAIGGTTHNVVWYRPRR